MDDVTPRQPPLPETIEAIRHTLLRPLPANMHERRDEFGCKLVRPQQVGVGDPMKARK